jgi:hypothetical protein
LTPDAGSWLVHLSDQSFAFVQATGTGAPVLLHDGFVMFREVVAGCTASPQSPCEIDIERVGWTLGEFQQGDFRVERFRFGFDQPMVLSDRGAGVTVPASAQALACADIDGQTEEAKAVTFTNIVIATDPTPQELSLRGSITVQFSFTVTQLTSGVVLSPVNVNFDLQVQATGSSPWIQG